jgi:hypothetical protein
MVAKKSRIVAVVSNVAVRKERFESFVLGLVGKEMGNNNMENNNEISFKGRFMHLKKTHARATISVILSSPTESSSVLLSTSTPSTLTLRTLPTASALNPTSMQSSWSLSPTPAPKYSLIEEQFLRRGEKRRWKSSKEC